MRIAGRIVLWALVVAALAIGLGVALPRGPAARDAVASGRTVLVLSNPIHTDIALPLDEDVLSTFADLTDAAFPVGDPAVRWLVFGWGGRSFYLETPSWSELRPLPVLKAVTIDRSVMHVALAGSIDRDQPEVLAVRLDEAGFARLVAFIDASFRRQADGSRPAIADAGYGAFDRFYEARGFFNALVGCNVWTAAALRAGHVRTGAWTPLPPLLEQALRLHNPREIFPERP